MLDATISAMGWAVSNYLIAGVEAQPIGNQNTTAAPSGAFRCADGQINIAANKQEQFERLCDLVGLSALKTDPRFAEREARKANRAALNALLDEALGARGPRNGRTCSTPTAFPPVASCPFPKS
jgi:crotonobetainyl-CoA:carnitine CoA-transferase CaiB-like acyl-CoA transferase